MSAESKSLESPAVAGSVSRTAQLRELLNAATPGPWAYMEEPYDWRLCTESGDATVLAGEDPHCAPSKADVELILEMHDALSALLDVAEAAREVAEHPTAVVDSGSHELLRKKLAALDNRKDKP